MNRREILAALLASPLAAAAATATSTDRIRLRAAELLADAALLQRAYETLHPGLLRYNTAARMNDRFAALRQALARDQPLADAYLAFSRFAATVRCGHTYANFYNQPKAIAAALFERDDRVPFHFRWLQGRMIVTRDFTPDAALPAGTEILAIDGEPAGAILARLMTIARADGANDAKRVAWLQVQGEDGVEAFDVFLPLLFPRHGARQRLRVAVPGARSGRTLTVDALSAARRRATRPARTDGEGALWTLDDADPALARLDMPTWALYESHWDWRAFLAASFETLARSGVPALVIDLRANEGGSDVGDVLLAHLAARPLPRRAARHLVRYRAVPADLAPHLDTWDKSFLDWGAAARPFDDRFLQLERDADDAPGSPIAPVAPRYDGRVFVLVGPTNSSATFEFAQLAAQSGRATLVGRPTGGNLRGINGGAFFFLRLPRSGIELDLPLIGQFPVGPLPPDRGLEPDVLVAPTQADIAAGRDPEMAAVRRLLAAGGPPTA